MFVAGTASRWFGGCWKRSSYPAAESCIIRSLIAPRFASPSRRRWESGWGSWPTPSGPTPSRRRIVPLDEHRFQVKYGSKDGLLHEIWQDPFELYTTLFFGINLEDDFFVGADPVLHSPTRFFISVEFKERNAEEILEKGWASWERSKRSQRRRRADRGPRRRPQRSTSCSFIRFERAAKGLDPGHRQLLADKIGGAAAVLMPKLVAEDERGSSRYAVPHAVAEEFELYTEEILDLIQSAPTAQDGGSGLGGGDPPRNRATSRFRAWRSACA